MKNEEFRNILKSYLLCFTSFQGFNDAERQNIPILIMIDVQFHIINTRRSQRPLGLLNEPENKHSGFKIEKPLLFSLICYISPLFSILT